LIAHISAAQATGPGSEGTLGEAAAKRQSGDRERTPTSAYAIDDALA